MMASKTTTTPPSVLLIGAGGAFGVPLIEEFIRQRASFARVAVLAAPAKASKFVHLPAQGIEVVVGEFVDESVFNGFDTVLSLVGNDLMAQQTEIFSAAIRAGVQHIYPSEYNSDLSQAGLRNLRYFRDKYAVREFLAREAEKEKGRFRTTYLETGIFTEWSVSEFYGVDTEAGVARVYGKGENELCVTSIPDIARYLVGSILLPLTDDAAERTIRVVGERLSFQRLLDTLGDAQGKKYDVRYLDPEEARRNELEAREKGDEKGEMMWSVKPLAASGLGIVVGGGVDNGKFEFRPETVRETFERGYGRSSSQL